MGTVGHRFARALLQLKRSSEVVATVSGGSISSFSSGAKAKLLNTVSDNLFECWKSAKILKKFPTTVKDPKGPWIGPVLHKL